MKYRLNKLVPKTTNHFNINDVLVDTSFHPYKMNGSLHLPKNKNISIKQEKVNKKIESKIGIIYEEYSCIDIFLNEYYSTDEIVYIDIELQKDDSFYGIINFNLGKHTKSNFIIRLRDVEVSTAFMIINVDGSSDAKFNLSFINELSKKSNSYIEFNGKSLEKDNIITNIVDFGGKVRLYRYDGLLEKEYANIRVNTLYIGYDDNLMDMNYYLTNKGTNSISNIYVVGAIGDKSRKNFRGTIDFISGSTGSIGEENEECILLSDECTSRSLPQMLCGEENVTGTHGVSSGKVSEEKLFYLMSRGYAKKDAEMLLVLGSFKKLLEYIPDKNLEEDIYQEFINRLI